jgi:excisionase family DNA binding protein
MSVAPTKYLAPRPGESGDAGSVDGANESQSLASSINAGHSTGARILTVGEVARELRCSKAHVHHLIVGQVCGVRPLPSLWLGRRRLILRASLDAWLKTSERSAG